jgi:hypothetical protein
VSIDAETCAFINQLVASTRFLIAGYISLSQRLPLNVP